jgi:ankyrin repeat protein
LLLRAGAKVDLRDRQGDTALTLAARDASVEVVRALLEAGADASLRNENRTNAADIATSLRRQQVSKLLADHK